MVNDWKNVLFEQFASRDRLEKNPFIEIFTDYNNLIIRQTAIKGRAPSKIVVEGSPVNSFELEANSKAQYAIRELTDEVTSKNIEIAKLGTRISILTEDIESLASDNDKLINESEALKTEKFALEDELKKCQEYVLRLEHRNTALESENAQLFSKLMKNMEEKLDSQNKSNQEIWESKTHSKTSISSPTSRESVCEGLSTSVVPKCEVKSSDLPDDSACLCYDSSGSQLAASSGKNIFIFSTKEGLKLSTRLTGPLNTVTSVDFSHNNNLIVASSSDKICYLWDTQSFAIVDVLTGHMNSVTVARFSPSNSSLLITAARDKSMKLWDLSTKLPTISLFLSSSCVSLVPFEATSVVSSHVDKHIRFFDLRSPKNMLEEAFPDKITSLCASADLRTIAVSCRDDSIYVCDPRFTKERQRLYDPSMKLYCDWTQLGLGPDGLFAAISSRENTVLVWNLSKKKIETTLQGSHRFPVSLCAWNPTGKGLVTCDVRKHLVAWD